MPDPADQNQAIHTEPNALTLGERLRSARKARALSLEQVASELHLSDSVIADLENDRFEQLGAPVYVRGHLRLYARMIGLAENDVLEAYREVAPESDIPPLVTSSSPVQQDLRLGLWGFWMLLVVVALAAVFYFFQPEPVSVRQVSMEPVATESTRLPDPIQRADEIPVITEEIVPVEKVTDVAAGLESFSGAANEPMTEVPAPASSETNALPPGLAESIEAESVSAAPDVATGSQREIKLTLIFAEETWAEISDVDSRLLFGLQQPGVRRELAGQPPFRLNLGNARGVNIYVDDSPYSIPEDRISANNVARFEIEAPSDE